MSRVVKIELYKMMKCVAVYGSEIWAVTEMDVHKLSKWRGNYEG